MPLIPILIHIAALDIGAVKAIPTITAIIIPIKNGCAFVALSITSPKAVIAIPIGLLLSVTLPMYAFETIVVAFGATAAIVTIMIALATAFPRFFLGLGRTLCITLLVTIIVEVVAMLLGFAVGWIDFIVVGIFTLYVGFDWSRAQAFPKTIDNAVDSAIDIYLDVINLFIRILSILGNRDD